MPVLTQSRALHREGERRARGRLLKGVVVLLIVGHCNESQLCGAVSTAPAYWCFVSGWWRISGWQGENVCDGLNHAPIRKQIQIFNIHNVS